MMRLDFDDSSCCQFCGSDLTKQFRRVFGDQNDVAHRCPNCDTHGRLGEGSAAGADVSDQTDPAEHPDLFNRDYFPGIPQGAEIATDGGVSDD